MTVNREDNMHLSAASMTASPYRDDEMARNRLITEYLPFVKRIVYRMAVHLPAHVDVDDLMNAGVIGLIQSIDRYDPARDNTLATFASFRIRGAVLSELRSRDVLSRGNRKKVREMQQAWIYLEQKLGREVEDWEVARELGMTAGELEDVRRMAGIYFVSIDDMDSRSDGEKENLLRQLVSGEDQDALMSLRAQEIKVALAKAVDELPEKEKTVISLYYVDELTLKEIGEVMNLTESRISQIHSGAIIHLRKKLIRNGVLNN
ncbi:MAG: FliA/WhiG family RNA polymerase sigma factor [Deltaproteobacteria bacterium]|nr:FliA/WhiG family RNA polymerase sigma factor [Deltaproteobacteria bacterium]